MHRHRVCLSKGARREPNITVHQAHGVKKKPLPHLPSSRRVWQKARKKS